MTEVQKLNEELKALGYVQTRAIYKYTGYSKYAVHQYLNDTLDAPEKFVKRFRMMVEELKHTDQVLTKHLPLIENGKY